MKNYILILLTSFALSACNDSESVLTVGQFSEAIFAGNIQLVDVRTPGEYRSEHIENAVNYDVNADDFSKQISSLDKSKPVYVYCLSGSRSSSATKILRSQGHNPWLRIRPKLKKKEP
jgi:rhodanese-related sulfurtransferase